MRGETGTTRNGKPSDPTHVIWNDRGQWSMVSGQGDQAKDDAEFIATFDPPTVRALLDLLDEFADIIDNITGEDHARARVAELEREGDGRG